MSDKGSPSEKMGRKATGLSPCFTGYGSRVAGQTQYLHGMYFARGINPSVAPPQTKIDNIKAIETGKHGLIISKGMGRISMFLLPRYSENKKDNKIRRYVCDV
jgi:hypothetical protein